jgi:hypothetical protein
MTNIEQKTLDKAITLLNALKIQFHIVDRDGKKHGNMQVAPPKKTRKPSMYKHGERTEYITKHLKGMEVGDVKVVPFGDYPSKMLTSNVSSWCCNRLGVGGAEVTENKEAKRVEVLRTK